jgi:hypothetical protein
VAFDRGYRQHVFCWRHAVVFFLILFPWFAFATVYFGSPIPNSIIAKSVANRLAPSEALRLNTYVNGMIQVALMPFLLAGTVIVVRLYRLLAPLIAWFWAHNILFILAGSNFQ